MEAASAAARAAWEAAVAAAEAERARLRRDVEEALRAAAAIRAELGAADDAFAPLVAADVGGSDSGKAPHRTLAAWRAAAVAAADAARAARAERLAEHGRLTAAVREARRAIGGCGNGGGVGSAEDEAAPPQPEAEPAAAAPVAAARPDLTPAGLEFLRVELAHLEAERVR